MCGKNENEISEELKASDSIFIGHGVTTDLKVLNISEVWTYDTNVIEFNPVLHHSRKLKDLSSKYLNASIQEYHHSSIIDSRSSLALFLKLQPQIEKDAPNYFSKTDGFCFTAARRRNNRMTESKIFHRQAFKWLDQNKNVEEI